MALSLLTLGLQPVPHLRDLAVVNGFQTFLRENARILRLVEFLGRDGARHVHEVVVRHVEN